MATMRNGNSTTCFFVVVVVFFKERENPLLSLNLQIPMMISILDCK